MDGLSGGAEDALLLMPPAPNTLPILKLPLPANANLVPPGANPLGVTAEEARAGRGGAPLPLIGLLALCVRLPACALALRPVVLLLALCVRGLQCPKYCSRAAVLRPPWGGLRLWVPVNEHTHVHTRVKTIAHNTAAETTVERSALDVCSLHV